MASREVFIVGAARTPIGSFQGALADVSATELGSVAIRAALERSGVSPEAVDETFMGKVLTAGLGQAPARQAAKAAGIPDRVPATTVGKVCGSGLQSVILGTKSILLGDAEVVLTGTRARLRLPSGPLAVELPLLGDFNLENLLVAAGCAVALGLPAEAIAAGAAACAQVPGRIERVDPNEPGVPTVLVDYAHTPDAVDKLLRTVRPLARGRLVTVFGCGGDRDRTKRAPMAAAVARWSDRVIATSDNPRTEDPERILDDVVVGLAGLRAVAPEALDDAERAYARIADRREAIALAVSLARADDTVVIAGKGHEDYQIVGRERLPFDDRAEARRALARRSGARA